MLPDTLLPLSPKQVWLLYGLPRDEHGALLPPQGKGPPAPETLEEALTALHLFAAQAKIPQDQERAAEAKIRAHFQQPEK